MENIIREPALAVGRLALVNLGALLGAVLHFELAAHGVELAVVDVALVRCDKEEGVKNRQVDEVADEVDLGGHHRAADNREPSEHAAEGGETALAEEEEGDGGRCGGVEEDGDKVATPALTVAGPADCEQKG